MQEDTAKTNPVISRAPKPISPVRGGSVWRSSPKPLKPVEHWPTWMSDELSALAHLEWRAAVAKFKTNVNLVEALRLLVSRMSEPVNLQVANGRASYMREIVDLAMFSNECPPSMTWDAVAEAVIASPEWAEFMVIVAGPKAVRLNCVDSRAPRSRGRKHNPEMEVAVALLRERDEIDSAEKLCAAIGALDASLRPAIPERIIGKHRETDWTRLPTHYKSGIGRFFRDAKRRAEDATYKVKKNLY